MKLCKNNSGYTMTELVIAIVIGSILIAATSATYISQNRSYVAQESVSELNTQSKLSQDIIANDIRSAGFGIPLNMNLDPINGYTSIITPVDSDAGPDAITIVGGFRMIGELLPPTGSAACGGTVARGTDFAVISTNGTIGPNMTDRSFLSIDGVEYVEIALCTLAGGSCDPANPVTFDRPLSGNYPVMDSDGDGNCNGRPVYLVEDVTYCIDANSNLRRIRRGADVAACAGTDASANAEDEPIAQHIEDLQFAYALDADNDGMLDGGGFINDGSVADPNDIRAVRINILGVADKADPDYEGLGMPPVAIENRSHVQAPDNFRRRWWQKTATIRNRRGQ